MDEEHIKNIIVLLIMKEQEGENWQKEIKTLKEILKREYDNINRNTTVY